MNPQRRSAVEAAARASAARVAPPLSWPRRAAGYLLLIGLSFAAFGPSLRNGYVSFDDGTYITLNPLLRDASGLWQLWRGIEFEQWYPLTFSTFWLEQQVGERLGLIEPAGYPHPGLNHGINVALHGLAGVLLMAVLVQLGLPRGWAWLAAALWIVHPLQVQSVVWAVERKNTLAGVFMFACAYAYLRSDVRYRSGWYLLSLLCFTLAMLSKTAFMLIFVPLLLCDWLRGRPLRWGSVLHVLPHLAIAATFASITVSAEIPELVGKVPPLLNRVAIAASALWLYLGMLLWPAGEVAIYPRWDPALTPLKLLALLGAAALAVVWVIAAVWRPVHHSRGLAAALICIAFYVVTQAATLGLIPFGYNELSFVANHFVYLAIAGPIVLAVLLLRRVAGRLERSILLLACAALIAGPAVYSHRRSQVWKDTRALYSDILRRNPGSPRAHLIYGLALQADNPTEAERYMLRATELAPDYFNAHHMLGRFYLQRKRDYPAATAALRQSLELFGRNADARWLLAQALLLQGQPAEALAQIEALPAGYRERPDEREKLLEAWASALSQTGQFAAALEKAQELRRLAPLAERSYELLASVQFRLARYDDVIATSNDLLALNGMSGRGYYLRGQAHRMMGDADAAARDFQEAIAIDPRLERAVQALWNDDAQPADAPQPTSAPVESP